jgi:hypothetical protein
MFAQVEQTLNLNFTTTNGEYLTKLTRRGEKKIQLTIIFNILFMA